MKFLPRIVIIGRPNVGKSSLFNRLISKKQALVHDLPGVTRDRMEQQVDWWIAGKLRTVLMTDTGGLGGEQFQNEIHYQVYQALEECHLIVFLLDSKVGLTQQDEALFLELNRSGRLKKTPILAVVNKVDVEQHESRMADFFSLGLEPILSVSAEHNRGIETLKETIVGLLTGWDEQPPLAAREQDNEQEDEQEDVLEVLPSALEAEAEAGTDSEAVDVERAAEEATETFFPKIAILGRPNVGKSTLLNALLKEERMITSPIAGTTIDSVDSLIQLKEGFFIFIDTAGIRRKGKTAQGVEVLSVVQSKKALDRADVALLLIDAEQGVSDQDEKIAGLIEEAGSSIILAVNKWDLHENTAFSQDHAVKLIRERMGFLRYAPILFLSAKEGKGLEPLGQLIHEILSQRKLKISTHEYTEWVRAKATIHNPMNAKFYLCHQTSRHPPTFVCHVNDPRKIHFSLKRHLVNAMRERWGFMGTPLRLLFLEAQNRRSLPRNRKKPLTSASSLGASAP